jgi:pimeloyl-ACP methyl ester carboxylesterase
MDSSRVRLLAFLAAASCLPASFSCDDPEVSGTEVQHTTPDGKTVSATYLGPNAEQAAPTLLLLHQPGSANSRHDFDDIWGALESTGLGLLAPDLRSHGLSDSGGDWRELATDPAGYPEDVLGWLEFIQFRQDEGDAVDRDRVGIIGLGTSASLGAAALGRNQVQCLVGVSPSIVETNALAAGFEPYVPDAGSDDDDSAGEARGGDDDDSATGDDDDSATAPPIDPSLALHDALWMFGSGDQPSATDAPALYEATTDDRDLYDVSGDLHGIEILWLSEDTKNAMVFWCVDEL